MIPVIIPFALISACKLSTSTKGLGNDPSHQVERLQRRAKHMHLNEGTGK